jgi:hypothetical protein
MEKGNSWLGRASEESLLVMEGSYKSLVDNYPFLLQTIIATAMKITIEGTVFY